MAPSLNSPQRTTIVMTNEEISKELRALREEVRAIRNHLESREMTDEEKEAYDECTRDIEKGRTVPSEQLERELQG